MCQVFQWSLIRNFLHRFLLNHIMRLVYHIKKMCLLSFGAQLVSHNNKLGQILPTARKRKSEHNKMIIQRHVFFKTSLHHFPELLFCFRCSFLSKVRIAAELNISDVPLSDFHRFSNCCSTSQCKICAPNSRVYYNYILLKNLE